MNHTIQQYAAEAAEVVLAAHPVLSEKISRALDIPPTESTAALTEVIRFMQLVSLSETPLTPSHKVDLAWHEFILFTRAYSGFCQEEFGEYIHHTPGGSRDGNNLQYRQTLSDYNKTFGPLSISYWDNPNLGTADCGACEAMTPINLQV